MTAVSLYILGLICFTVLPFMAALFQLIVMLKGRRSIPPDRPEGKSRIAPFREFWEEFLMERWQLVIPFWLYVFAWGAFFTFLSVSGYLTWEVAITPPVSGMGPWEDDFATLNSDYYYAALILWVSIIPEVVVWSWWYYFEFGGFFSWLLLTLITLTATAFAVMAFLTTTNAGATATVVGGISSFLWLIHLWMMKRDGSTTVVMRQAQLVRKAIRVPVADAEEDYIIDDPLQFSKNKSKYKRRDYDDNQYLV